MDTLNEAGAAIYNAESSRDASLLDAADSSVIFV